MPSAAPTICKCGYVKTSGERCPRCEKVSQKSYNKFQRDKETYDNVYGTERWRSLRELALKRDKGLCVICLKANVIERATIVDHKLEINDGGEPFDIENLQSLCSACHNKKSAEERKRRENDNI